MRLTYGNGYLMTKKSVNHLLSGILMNTLNDDERTLIVQVEEFGDPTGCIAAIRKSVNPFFFQQLATVYNWDDGFEVPREIAEHEYCDIGTALTLFWLAEAMSFYTKEVERTCYNEKWADFCELLTHRITDGHYKIGPVSYKPEISKVTAYEYKKQNIPTILYEEVVGIND